MQFEYDSPGNSLKTLYKQVLFDVDVVKKNSTNDFHLL